MHELHVSAPEMTMTCKQMAGSCEGLTQSLSGYTVYTSNIKISLWLKVLQDKHKCMYVSFLQYDSTKV